MSDASPASQRSASPRKRRRVDEGRVANVAAAVDDIEVDGSRGGSEEVESDQDDSDIFGPGSALSSQQPPPSSSLTESLSSTITKHADIWFEDGNIVLVAEPSYAAFRVYRGILLAECPTFREVFPPPAHVPTVEDCPVLYLRDSPEDVENFLRILYQGSRWWCEPSGTTKSWGLIRAAIRLGRKYGAQTIYDSAVRDFHKRLPPDIRSWDDRHRSTRNSADAISMTNVARLLREPDLHLRALYGCCQLPAEVLQAGGEQETLCDEDLRAVIDGKTTLYRLNMEHLSSVLSSTKVPSHEGCDAKRLTAQQSILKHVAHIGSDALDSWAMNVLKKICDEAQVCEDCTKKFSELHTEARQEALTNLNTYFNVTI